MSRKFLNITLYVLPIFIVVFMWVIVFIDNATTKLDINTEEILKAEKYTPSDNVLNELDVFKFGLEDDFNKNDINFEYHAKEILNGNFLGLPISFPINSDEVKEGSLERQLKLAGFMLPYILLKSYQKTENSIYMEKTIQFIKEWASYENSVYFSRGFLWNDHAIASRVLVLSKFWSIYRHYSNYNQEVANTTLSLIYKYAQLLAKPTHFTYATNHGVIQNLALFHLAITFPYLPNAEEYKNLAFQRLNLQLQFYINSEGIILEHSPGYHKAGLQFFAMALRYLTILDLPIPSEWIQKFNKAKVVYANSVRPDGSLPKFGDTGDSQDFGLWTIDIVDRKSSSLYYKQNFELDCSDSLYPVAGFAIWCDNSKDSSTQIATTWSYFKNHGHKHADELSLSLWDNGQAWIDNVGYWPYGNEYRKNAESWLGSNAPHFAHEKQDNNRHSYIQGNISNEKMAFIDLIRHNTDNAFITRQIVYIKPNFIVVLDNAKTLGDKNLQTIWTFNNNLIIDKLKNDEHSLTSSKTSKKLLVHTLNSLQTYIKKGSYSPFAGWGIYDGKILPSSSLIIEQRSSIPMVTLLELSDNGTSKIKQSNLKWFSEKNWNVNLTGLTTDRKEIVTTLNRSGDVITINGLSNPIRGSFSDIKKELSNIENSLTNMKNIYPTIAYIDYSKLVSVTVALLILVIMQAGVFIVVKKFCNKFLNPVMYSAVISWFGLSYCIFVKIIPFNL